MGVEAGEAIRRWVSSGCSSLTGPPESTGLGPPEGLVEALDVLAGRVARRSAAIGARVVIDPLEELGVRARLGLRRRGRTTCGGAGRLLRCADGWVALTLARDDDLELVPALIAPGLVAPSPVDLGPGHHGSDAIWNTVSAWCCGRTAADVVDRAVLLGLPVAELPGTAVRPGHEPATICTPMPAASSTSGANVSASTGTAPNHVRLRVLDLSSLWAGPLCAVVLAAGGHDVVKLECVTRPDGARRGPVEMLDRLNAGKRSVALDLTTEDGRASVRRLAAAADVVIEASRPRVLERWGVDPSRPDGSTRVWLSITAHGYRGEGADRVGFGDDAAVGGGLVAWNDEGPWFCGDAIADPLTGIVAADEVLTALTRGGRWHLDVAMRRVAAQFAAPTVDLGGADLAVEVPVASSATAVCEPAHDEARDEARRGRAAPLGQHTAEVLREWLQ